MPKKKQGNQHNHRHENGIVAPGKRIIRQRSVGHINGNAVEAPSTTTSSDPSVSDDHATSLTPETGLNGQPMNMRNNVLQAQEQIEDAGERAASALEPPSANFSQVHGGLHASENKPAKIAPKDSAKWNDNTLNLALTIIRSCPLFDTLAILIILLSIPSTFLTVINLLFACLTFVPPTRSFLSLPNTFSDVFQGSGGTPSLATTIITDMLGTTVWLVLSRRAQALAIECAQAVVAAAYGGSNTSKKTGSDSTFLCMAIVTVCHAICRNWIPAPLLGFDWRDILSRIPYVDEGLRSFISLSNDDFLTAEPRGGWEWFRIGIALHILIQGLVHMARRWYQKKEYFQPTSVPRKMDPEVGASNASRPGPNPLADSPLSSNNIPSPSTTSKSSLPIVKDTRDKTSRGKKRRKQVAQVRSQQPLWAAIAATKVTIMREVEHGQNMADFNDSNARDAKDLGNASFGSRENQTWVSDVRPDSFTLNTTCSTAASEVDDCSNVEAAAGMSKSKPFYVRINGTDWTSTRISRCEQDGNGRLGSSIVVFGLAPSSCYRCSLVSNEGDVTLSTVTVTTSPSLSEENEPNTTSSESPQRAQRPYSPTSPSATLKKSISAFKASLNESAARQKKSKKDIKATSTSTKKEIDVLNAKIMKLTGEDRSHTNRHMQWNQHTRQAEEALVALSAEIESLEGIPEEETQARNKGRSRWDDVKQRQRAVRDNLLQAKEIASKEKSAAQNEANSARQKKDRLEARKTKLSDQLEKLTLAAATGTFDRDRNITKPTPRDMQRMQIEQDLRNQMRHAHYALEGSQYSIAQYGANCQKYELGFQEQQAMSSSTPEPVQRPLRPLTPEGDLPGENPQNAATAIPRIHTFGTPESSGLRGQSGSFRQDDHRLRSSSLQSGNSNYVDFDDQDPAPPMPPRAFEAIKAARKRSAGSAGGSSGSNSQHDPASPLAANSPLGKKSPVWNQ